MKSSECGYRLPGFIYVFKCVRRVFSEPLSSHRLRGGLGWEWFLVFILFFISCLPSSIRGQAVVGSPPENDYAAAELSSLYRALNVAPKTGQSHCGGLLQLIGVGPGMVRVVELVCFDQMICPDQQFSGHGDGGLFLSGACSDAVVDDFASSVVCNGDPCGLLQYPSGVPGSLLGHFAVSDGFVGLEHSRIQSDVVDQLFYAIESRKVFDLCDKGPCDNITDTGQRVENLKETFPMFQLTDVFADGSFDSSLLSFEDGQFVGDIPGGGDGMFRELVFLGLQPSGKGSAVNAPESFEIALQQVLSQGVLFTDLLSDQSVSSSGVVSQCPEPVRCDIRSQVIVPLEQSDMQQLGDVGGVSVIGFGSADTTVSNLGGICQVDAFGVWFGHIVEPVIEADRLDGDLERLIDLGEECPDLINALAGNAFV